MIINIGDALREEDIDSDVVRLISYRTISQFIDEIHDRNLTSPYWICSTEMPASNTMHKLKYTKYYCLLPSEKQVETQDKVLRDVIYINSIQYFLCVFYNEMGEYYRDQAYDGLHNRKSQHEIKELVRNAKRCFERSKACIEKL